MLLGRGVVEDRLDVLGEAHLEHLVGLVEDEEAQLGQVEGALLEVVHDPAGVPTTMWTPRRSALSCTP